MNRAYSVLDVKDIDDSGRVIEGIASTPTADRMGDVVDPMGAQFAIPMPLLWQHDSGKPVGTVEFAKATKTGIPFRATLAAVTEAGALRDRIEEAWQSIKYGLVRAVSIGFKPLKYAYMDDGGIEFQQWEWLELSLVTIPANSEAVITAVKALDQAHLPAIGQRIISLPGVSGKETARKSGIKLIPRTYG